MVKRIAVQDAKRLLADVVTMLETRSVSAQHPMTTERLALLETVTKYPARSGCAALAWATLESVVDWNAGLKIGWRLSKQCPGKCAILSSRTLGS